MFFELVSEDCNLSTLNVFLVEINTIFISSILYLLFYYLELRSKLLHTSACVLNVRMDRERHGICLTFSNKGMGKILFQSLNFTKNLLFILKLKKFIFRS